MTKSTKDNIQAISFSILLTSAVVALSYMNGKENDKKMMNPKIVVIDGCEYIFTKAALGSDKYEHKANCKNH